jgi:hypothetical protein
VPPRSYLNRIAPKIKYDLDAWVTGIARRDAGRKAISGTTEMEE